MGIPPFHLPFIVLFFCLVVVALLASAFAYLLQPSKNAGRRWFYGTVGAVCAFVAYQLVYMLLLPLSIVVTALVGAFIPEGLGWQSAASFVSNVSVTVFLTLWFIALPMGVNSGFRIGWHFGDGHPLSDKLQSDYLFRLFVCSKRALQRYRVWRDKALKRKSSAPPP